MELVYIASARQQQQCTTGISKVLIVPPQIAHMRLEMAVSRAMGDGRWAMGDGFVEVGGECELSADEADETSECEPSPTHCIAARSPVFRTHTS
jgi:hypothetical protein